ncbi:MAG: FecR domain-containing protein [Marinilabilia sp.]
MSENNQNIDWELAARVLSGEGDEIDHGLLEQWLSADPANREEWKEIKEAWAGGKEGLFFGNINTSGAWERVRQFTVDDTVTSPRRRVLGRAGRIAAIAASVVLIAGAVWLLFSPFSSENSSLIVSSSDREEVELSDGSTITLNSGSRFTCRQPFDEKERVVDLDGEGYFRVEGNSERPFVVHAGDVTIRVTGTRFNVRAYPNLEITEVGVIEGSVEIFPPSGEEKTRLEGGQTALFDKTAGQMTVKDSTDPNLLAWITRKMKFNETPLKEVTRTLERVYDVDIQLTGEDLPEQKLTASFSDNSLDFVLQVVCVTFNLEEQREGETIILTRSSERE